MKKKSLKINAFLNGLKQCFGIIFPLITFPYVSRTLGQEGFGSYSFSWSIVSYFILIAGLGINTYAIREGARIRENKKKINQFCSEIYTINIITTVLSLILLCILVFFNNKMKQYYILILIESNALILNLIGRDWINSIYEDFWYITLRYIIVQAFALIMMFLFIRDSNDVWKYCAINIFASFGGNIFNTIYIKKYIQTRIVNKPKIKKHIKPMLILFVTQVAITIYVNADITMLGFYTNDSIVGIYSLASKIYSMIKTVINAIVSVALPRITYVLEKSPEQYIILLKKVSSFLILLVLPISCGIFLLSDEVIKIVGGDTFLSGAIVLRYLSFAMIFAILDSFCMNCILIANRKENECLKATGVSALVNICLNFIFIPVLGIIGAAITTIIAEVINLILLLKYSKQSINLNFFDFKNIFQCLLSCIAIIIICYFVKKLKFESFITLIVAFIFSALGYFIMLVFLKNEYIKNIINKIFIKLKREES